MTHRSRWTLLPLLVALALFAYAVPDAGFIADDTINLSEHARHGDLSGEWTTPTYAHAGGERGHIWRPIPATVQHFAAITFGRSGEVFRTLNLAVHLLNVWLVTLVARRWGASHASAGLAALLWTTHSSMPEAICWSSDIYDLMATTAMLAGLAVISAPLKTLHWASLSAITLIACLCKESALALIPALSILTIYQHGRTEGLKSVAALGSGGAVYWVWHRQVTAQGYVDALADGSVMATLDAWLMSFGWMAFHPNRAPMAHLFDRIGDTTELWYGVAAVVVFSMMAADQFYRNPKRPTLIFALLATGILLVPAAVGIPFIGVAPLRYIYMPLALLISIGASSWTSKPTPKWTAVIGVLSLFGSVHIIKRVPAFQSDIKLWSAERALEPKNPYAGASLARALIANKQSDEGINLWADAINNAPSGVRVFDQANERWLLAQTAFLKQRPAVALKQVNHLIAASKENNSPLPQMAHCLRADSLDALGRHEQASAAGTLCRP